MTTEHCFQTTEKVVSNVQSSGMFYKLLLDGELSNGIPFYKMDGYMESEILEIGDLFKEFKAISSAYLDSVNLGAYKTGTRTTATVTDNGSRLTISGQMPAADNVGIRTDTFLMSSNRYFEWEATDTNRYLFIDLIPEDNTTGLAKESALLYMLTDSMVANVTYRILLDMSSKIVYVYNGEALVTQKSFAHKDFSKPHRLAIVSSSSRSHTMYLNYARGSFEYRIPSGYLALNEERTDPENTEIYTTTSMDGAIWEDYLPLDGDGNVQSSVGKFFKVKMKLTTILEEYTFKEYDYVNKDESDRVWAKEGISFDVEGLMAITEDEVIPYRYLDGDTVMYRAVIDNKSFRVDGIDLIIEAVE